MKHLIETTDPSGLTRVDYNRIILDSDTDDIIVRRGVNANGHAFVDLGLPSGTLWAKCNIGAATELIYGDYFMWGSTTPNNDTTCNWANAPFNGGAEKFDEKYFNDHKSEWLDDNGNLKPEYDAARAIMGGDWRMPTQAECQELIDNTTNKWVENFNHTGANGYKFTSKKDTSKYILIFASGFREKSTLYNRATSGCVWSSSLNTSSSIIAQSLRFSSDGVKTDYKYDSRTLAMNVRGVL